MTALINLITPPDKLFNSNMGLLLVSPSDSVKAEFNKCATQFNMPINLYLYEDNGIQWLLDIAQSVDHIIIDIDNIKDHSWIIGYLLSFDKTFYLTNATNTVYNVINANRIYDLKQFMEGVEYFGIQEK